MCVIWKSLQQLEVRPKYIEGTKGVDRNHECEVFSASVIKCGDQPDVERSKICQ